MRIRRHSNLTQILTVRLLTGAVALATAIKLLYFLPIIVAQYQVVPIGIFIFGLVGEFAIPLLGGLLAFGGGLPLLRWVNAATVIGHVLVTVFSFVLFATTDNSWTPPWIFVSAGSAVSAAICWRWKGVILLISLGMLSVVQLPFTVFAGTNVSISASAGIQMVVGMAVFGGIAVAVVASSRLLDRVAAEAAQSVAFASAQRARQETSVHSDAIMHDDILGTLLFGAENNPLFRNVVATQASRALIEIKKLSVGLKDNVIELDELRAEASEIVHQLDPAALIVMSGENAGRVPGFAVDALLGALTQALTNSVLHARVGITPVRRVVTLTGVNQGIEISVQDDGVGFNPASVSQSRLGIRSSIHARMNAIQGGSSRVESALGKGTTVNLSWSMSQAVLTEDKDAGSAAQLNTSTLRILRIVVWTFLVGQIPLSIVSILSMQNTLASIVALIALAAPVILLINRRFVMDSTVATVLVVGVIVAASMVFFQGFDVTRSHAGVWFLSSGAMLLLALVFSRRGLLAWVVMGVIAVFFFADSFGEESGFLPGFELIVRPIGLLLVGTLFSVPLNLFQPRINALRAESRRLLGDQAFVVAATIQRQSEAVRLRSLAGPLLETLARAVELTPAQVTECVALEGLLRDQARGNLLSRGELAAAAGSARTRGIDVMLLDDSDGEGVTDSDIENITNWMSDHLQKMTDGQFVGRVLPPGRPDVATIVIADRYGPVRLSLPR